MLVLTRKENERIVVVNKEGEIIMTICLTAIQGNKVRLGFEAGSELEIWRQEVYNDKQRS
jgi:carbon storage regulator CsrA